MSHLIFSDDLMLFCRANESEALHIRRCLQKFESWIGETINSRKSFLYFNNNQTEQRREQIQAF